MVLFKRYEDRKSVPEPLIGKGSSVYNSSLPNLLSKSFNAIIDSASDKPPLTPTILEKNKIKKTFIE